MEKIVVAYGLSEENLSTSQKGTKKEGRQSTNRGEETKRGKNR